MMTTVKKPFNTPLRRWVEGDKVHADADLAPHTIESLKAGGFIAVPAPAHPAHPAPAHKKA